MAAPTQQPVGVDPRPVDAGQGLRVLRLVRGLGPQALPAVVETALGADRYAALLASGGSDQHIQQQIDAAVDAVFGPKEQDMTSPTTAAATPPDEPAIDGADLAPIAFDTTAPAPDVERIEVFTIDGKPYTIPKKLPVQDALRGLEVMADGGEAVLIPFLARAYLGDDGYKALLAVPTITDEQINPIMRRLRKMFLQRLREIAGN
ncbi:hypothetical protein [Rhizomonospora bruguierae]|uniref:hypothetical protein n=1 Tax=Rhizomonospora bruguierae TaxID=1581705 RepID=UPI001BCAF82A|nr:hypothetical protein [Micromonospora sp. NBRC 107566]